MKPVLYHYWRSSSSWRVRWALRLKGVACDTVAVDLAAGEQGGPAHRLRNPGGTVPVLQVGPVYLAESMAIIEYLEETYPEPRLLPADALGRAQVRQLAELINAGTQPLQNLSVLRYVSEDPEQHKAWARHFIARGLAAYEALLGQPSQTGQTTTSGPFSMGADLTLADLFLVPQCYNARRFGLDLGTWPRIQAIEAHCLATPAARDSAPDQQPR